MSLQNNMNTQTHALTKKREILGYAGYCGDQNFAVSKIYAKEVVKSNFPKM